jgi:propionyl-CoA synthetase
MGRYQQAFQRSLTQPDEFWRAAAGLIDWYTEPIAVLDRSGKILRKTMRGIAEGGDEPVPSTIDDPAALDALRPLLYGN